LREKKEGRGKGQGQNWESLKATKRRAESEEKTIRSLFEEVQILFFQRKKKTVGDTEHERAKATRAQCAGTLKGQSLNSCTKET